MLNPMDEFSLAKLAREMAMNIRPYKEVFADFNLTEEDYYEISKLDFYKRCKEQFALEWNSSLSAADRVRLISASYAEELLPLVGRRIKDPNAPLVGILDGYKTLCRNAGIGDPKQDNKTTDRFTITINIGEETKTFDKSLSPDIKTIDLLPTAK